MALGRARRTTRGFDYWPGFVDALSVMLLTMIFLLSVFMLAQFFLSRDISGKDTALAKLTRQIDELDGLPSRTDFQVIERCPDGTSLLEAKLGSGRTHQIRIHLWQLGFPVAGDPAYLPGRKIGDTQTLDPAAPPLQLHAWQLAFRHPLSGAQMRFQTARPNWWG